MTECYLAVADEGVEEGTVHHAHLHVAPLAGHDGGHLVGEELEADGRQVHPVPQVALDVLEARGITCCLRQFSRRSQRKKKNPRRWVHMFTWAEGARQHHSPPSRCAP